MKIELIRGHELPADVVSAWAALQAQDPALDSPFFHPQFTQAAAAVRDDVEVAVIENAGRIAGIFAFERRGWSIAYPVGGRINDLQGVVAEPGLPWTPEWLMRECRLNGWAFENLLASQRPWQPFHSQVREAPHLDLSAGFDAYYRARRDAGSQRVIQFLRKLRKMEREVGPVRFVAETRDAALWQKLLEWKNQQYRRQKVASPLTAPRLLAILERLMQCEGPDFRGYLSALYTGDQLAAVLLSLRCRRVWHHWVPTYNVELQRYSPGSLLLTRIATESEALGIDRIDLAAGYNEYKDSFANGTIAVAEGSVDLLPGIGLFRAAWRGTRNLVKGSPLYGVARGPIRSVRRVLDLWSYG
jgi:CelD/BcsL family acetyltransferase involved in cellulose biosynthesis